MLICLQPLSIRLDATSQREIAFRQPFRQPKANW